MKGENQKMKTKKIPKKYQKNTKRPNPKNPKKKVLYKCTPYHHLAYYIYQYVPLTCYEANL